MEGAPITRDLQPVYLLACSDPLLQRDWLDGARRALREAGFEDLLTLVAEPGFAWDSLLEDHGSLSLFSARKCRVVVLPTGKPGTDGGRVIRELCAAAADDSVYIFVAPALDRQTRNAAWCQQIGETGRIVELKSVDEARLPDWLQQRARTHGLELDGPAAQFLAERTEGNLLAADQELIKLKIRRGEQSRIGLAEIEEAVSRSARYSHFLLVDACLAGKARRALRILASLRAEGYATPQLRWALQAALEQLDQLKQAERFGGLGDRSWRQFRIWGQRPALFRAALARLDTVRIERLLQSCARVDRLGKGQQEGDFDGQDWHEIESLVVDFSTTRGNDDERGGRSAIR